MPVFERKNRQISEKQKFQLFLPNFYMDLREVAFFVVFSATEVLYAVGDLVGIRKLQQRLQKEKQQLPKAVAMSKLLQRAFCAI